MGIRSKIHKRLVIVRGLLMYRGCLEVGGGVYPCPCSDSPGSRLDLHSDIKWSFVSSLARNTLEGIVN